jgi:hypothetical protein
LASKLELANLFLDPSKNINQWSFKTFRKRKKTRFNQGLFNQYGLEDEEIFQNS